MSVGDEFGLSGLAALGAIAKSCAQEKPYEVHDETTFELRAMCADYRLALSKLEEENRTLRTALLGSHSPFDPVPGESQEAKGRRQHGDEQCPKSTAEKFKTHPEDVL